MLMPTLTENTLLDQLKNEQNTSFELLYRLYYPTVAAYVTRNSGNTADADDIFQETIMILLQQVRKADFVLTSSLKTYLVAIARNLWLNRLRAAKNAPLFALTPTPSWAKTPGSIRSRNPTGPIAWPDG